MGSILSCVIGLLNLVNLNTLNVKDQFNACYIPLGLLPLEGTR